jgi:hypothetical protein
MGIDPPADAKTRDAVLTASRWVGWMLASAVAAVCIFGVMAGLNAVQDRRVVGRSETRAFVDKVRACFRAPKPHPTWSECERRVQDRD